MFMMLAEMLAVCYLPFDLILDCRGGQWARGETPSDPSSSWARAHTVVFWAAEVIHLLLRLR